MTNTIAASQNRLLKQKLPATHSTQAQALVATRSSHQSDHRERADNTFRTIAQACAAKTVNDILAFCEQTSVITIEWRRNPARIESPHDLNRTILAQAMSSLIGRP